MTLEQPGAATRTGRRAWLGGPGLLVLLLVTPPLLMPGAALSVTDLTAGATILCRPSTPATRFSLVFTHSMYGGDVIEEFGVTETGKLRRLSVTTDNAAAAEYYAYYGNVVRDGARFAVRVPPAVFAELVVRADDIGDHRLAVDGADIRLRPQDGSARQIRLAVVQRPMIERLLGMPC